MEPEGSLPHLQELATCSYPKLLQNYVVKYKFQSLGVGLNGSATVVTVINFRTPKQIVCLSHE